MILETRNSEPATVLVLGATSAIAGAYARLCAAEGLNLVLAGRRADRLTEIAADLMARGATSAEICEADLADPDRIDALWRRIETAHGTASEVFLAYGVLGDPEKLRSGTDALAEHLRINFTSAALWIERAAGAMERAGRGRIVVIGSVAGDRGRQSNYEYGAAKAGLERFVQGVQHRFRLHGRGLSAHIVKPGFVDTPMTDGLDKSGPLWATPERVAIAIRRAVLAGRRTIYVPWFWRPIMSIICVLPAAVLHRTRL